MARPKSITDERLLAAAGAVIGRVGPGFTLAQVAEEAGVAVGSVARRFGSKHGLLQALNRVAAEEAPARLRRLADAADDPGAGLVDALVAVYSGLGDAAEAANHLGQLGVDIGDPVLRELLGNHYTALERELRVLCERARRAAGKGWRGPEPARAARVLLAAANGVAFDWSVRPHGELADRLREDIEAIAGSWYT